MRRADPGLKALQRWMQAVIMRPGGVGDGARSPEARRELDLGARTLEAVLEPGPHLGAAERLQIYGNMYFWRLVDIMAEEYPTVRAIVGAEEWYRIAEGYIVAHPSTSYSLNPFSRAFPAWLRKEARGVKRRALLADVATVERAMEDVFDEKAAKPVSVRRLKAIPLARWAGARFRLIPALRLLVLSHPVNDLIAAARKEAPLTLPARGREWLVVYRKSERVWRARLSEEKYVLLDALGGGCTLTEGFERCAALRGFDAGAFTAGLSATFQGWASDGIFADVEPGPG